MLVKCRKGTLTEDQKEHILHNLWVDVHKWYDKYNCTHDVNYAWNDFLEYYDIIWKSFPEIPGSEFLIFIRKGTETESEKSD